MRPVLDQGVAVNSCHPACHWGANSIALCAAAEIAAAAFDVVLRRQHLEPPKDY